jgi:hypothetical protein
LSFSNRKSSAPITTTVVGTAGFGAADGVAGFVLVGVLGVVDGAEVGVGVTVGVEVSVGVGDELCVGAGLDVLGVFVAEDVGVGLELEEHPVRRIELRATTVIAMKDTRFTVDTSFSCLGLTGVIGGINTGGTRRYRFVVEHNPLG